MNKCGVIKDLLPLYADEVCSADSKELVEEHIASCEDCKQELEDYRYNTGLPQVKADEALKSFKKKMSKKTIVTVAVSLVLCLAVIFGAYYIMFEHEYVVKYSDDLLTVTVPDDGGIDVWVNLDNYWKVSAWDYTDAEGNTDVYLTVIQNNFTKIFPDKNNNSNFWRTNNGIGLCNQSGTLCPIGGDDPNYKVKNIYYLELICEDEFKKSIGDDVLDTLEAFRKIIDDSNPQLIWSAPEE